jgi:carboxymethylenebutenolidase
LNSKTIFSILLFGFILLFLNGLKETYAQDKRTKGDSIVKMADIKTKMVNYLSGKDTVRAYLAEPEGTGPFPALILIHEWWGLNDWIKKDAEEFADSGYVALAVDLYHGKSATAPEEARKLSGSVQQEQAETDLRSAFDYLSDMKEVDKTKIGSIGWCMGGKYSLIAALNIPDLSACVICYGRLVTDAGTLKKINCPVLGIFGENDQSITPATVRIFKESLDGEGIKNKITVYPGVGHAFMNPGNSGLYNKNSSQKAWEEIYTFLDSYLKLSHK